MTCGGGEQRPCQNSTAVSHASHGLVCCPFLMERRGVFRVSIPTRPGVGVFDVMSDEAVPLESVNGL